MSDLIRRGDALKALLKVPCKIDSDNYTWIRLSDAFGTIDEDVPSAEPERPKGEWVDGLPYVNSHWWVCSICHVPAPENHTGYNFCPNCGARMTRGE